MKVTLIFEKLPITLEEYDGMWLGIGFGKGTMVGSDLYICEWNDILSRASCAVLNATSYIYSSTPPPLDTF